MLWNFEPPACDVAGVSIFERHFIVSCEKRSSRNTRGSNSLASIRVYEDQRPFDLLMLMAIEEIGSVGDLLSNSKSRSLFVPDERNRCIWELRWSDHRAKTWKGNLKWPLALSVSREGNLILISDDDDHLRIYDANAVLISSIPLSPETAKYPEYMLRSPAGYNYSVSHRLNFSRAVLVDRLSDWHPYPLEATWKSELRISTRKSTLNETGEEIVRTLLLRHPFIIPEVSSRVDTKTLKLTMSADVVLIIPTMTRIDSENSSAGDDLGAWWTEDQSYSGFENRISIIYDCPLWSPWWCERMDNWTEFGGNVGIKWETTFCYEDKSGHLIISTTFVNLRSASSAVFIVRLH